VPAAVTDCGFEIVSASGLDFAFSSPNKLRITSVAL
jgi:hypothetical protein